MAIQEIERGILSMVLAGRQGAGGRLFRWDATVSRYVGRESAAFAASKWASGAAANQGNDTARQ